MSSSNRVLDAVMLGRPGIRGDAWAVRASYSNVPRRTLALGWSKTVLPAVEDLLEREQRHKRAADREGDIEIGNGRHRRHAETAKAGQEILPPKDTHCQADTQHHQAVEHLHEVSECAAHALGDRRKEQVVVSAGRHCAADEDTVDEEG